MMTPHRAETTVVFPAGLPGFEACRRYVLIEGEAFAPGVCLKGLEGPAPAFLAVDPRRIDPDYVTELSPADRARLGAGADTACMWLALVTTGPGEPRANLAAPIVINPVTMRGIQVLPADAAVPADVPWREAPCLS